MSVAQGDCDDRDSTSLTNCARVPEVAPPRTCSGSDCSNADQDGDGLTPAQGDCDDSAAGTYPGAPDACGDGLDSDCDGFDDDCPMVDADGDGLSPQDGDGGPTQQDDDCDDTDPNAAAGSQELCGDGVDNDCDGQIDRDCTVGPDSPIAISLSTDDVVTLHVRAKLPDARAGEVGGDVMFLVDQSASFGDDIATFRRSATDILAQLSQTFGDLRIGLASFRDAPCSIFGSALEWAYKLNLPLTDDLSAFEAVMETLATAPGDTTPEAALEGIAQVLTGRGRAVNGFGDCDIIADIAPSNPGWVRGRIPLLIVSTDAPFNRPGDPSYPYATGVADAIELALDSGTRVFFMVSGERDPEDQLIAHATGGQVFELAVNSDGLVVALGDALQAALSEVTVSLSAQGAGAELVEAIEPDTFEGINLLVDDTIDFEVTFKRTVSRKTSDQVFTFDLVVSAHGAESARIPMTVIIPGIDV